MTEYLTKNYEDGYDLYCLVYFFLRSMFNLQ